MKEIVRANIGFKRWFFFVAGIIATLAYRIIIVLDEFWIKIAWYVGTVGFILYFGHRSHVQKKRKELVNKNNLVKIVDDLKGVKVAQKEALHYLVKSAITSKVRWNSLFIFWLSVLALVIGIFFDFVF